MSNIKTAIPNKQERNSKAKSKNMEVEFEKVMELLQTKYGWDWTTAPDEKKITADIINDTIKAVKFISSKPDVSGSLPVADKWFNLFNDRHPDEVENIVTDEFYD